MLIKDSSISNHSSKYTVLVIVVFTEKEKRHISKKDRVYSKLVSILLFVCESCDSNIRWL